MQRLAKLVVVAGLAVTACSNSGANREQDSAATDVLPVASADEVAVQTTAVSVADSTTSTPVLDPVTEEDLIRFIAATESVLRGTAQEGVVYDSPEVYIAMAQAACARFTDGEEFDQIANDLLDELTAAGLSDEDRLVGAILGAATQTICPEHAAAV